MKTQNTAGATSSEPSPLQASAAAPERSPMQGRLSSAYRGAQDSPLAVVGALMLMIALFMGLTGNGLGDSEEILAAQQAAQEAAATAPGYVAF